MIINHPTTGPDDATAEVAFASAQIGQGSNGLLSLFHPTAIWGDNGHTVQKIVSAASANVAGAYQISTGASANSSYLMIAGSGAGFFATPFVTAVPWYLSGRFAVTTAITAQTRAGVGAFNFSGATITMLLGVNGATSTGFFSLTPSSGSAIVTTVAIDTNTHTHRAWRVGGTTFYSIDGAVFSNATADISAACGPMAQVVNGTDAVARTVNLMWYFGASQGA